jgi:hypothetical protein
MSTPRIRPLCVALAASCSSAWAGTDDVKVTAADGADLAKNKLTLEYSWWDGQEAKGLTATIDKLPFERTVEVQQKGVPKMKFVKLSVAR